MWIKTLFQFYFKIQPILIFSLEHQGVFFYGGELIPHIGTLFPSLDPIVFTDQTLLASCCFVVSVLYSSSQCHVSLSLSLSPGVSEPNSESHIQSENRTTKWSPRSTAQQTANKPGESFLTNVGVPHNSSARPRYHITLSVEKINLLMTFIHREKTQFFFFNSRFSIRLNNTGR